MALLIYGVIQSVILMLYGYGFSLVYGISGNNFCSVDTDAATPDTTTISILFGGELPRLSPDAALVTYSKSGEESGIYIMYTATGTEEIVIQ